MSTHKHTLIFLKFKKNFSLETKWKQWFQAKKYKDKVSELTEVENKRLRDDIQKTQLRADAWALWLDSVTFRNVN